MTAVWWLSRHSLFLASSDSALGASVHHAPGLDGNRTEMGEGGGGVGRQAAHGVPCDLYHPDAAQGGGAGSSSALGLSVPATVVLLQRLVQTELAMLLRHLSSVCSNSPPEGVSATTAHGQHAGGAGKRSGFPREESEWRVGRVVCLAHAACCLAARSPRYHHTLYLFFKVTPVVLPACLHACIPACLHACIPACLHACMPACLHARCATKAPHRRTGAASSSFNHAPAPYPFAAFARQPKAPARCGWVHGVVLADSRRVRWAGVRQTPRCLPSAGRRLFQCVSPTSSVDSLDI